MKSQETTQLNQIEGKNGQIIKLGDVVIYTNNPFCKPSKVVRIFQDRIYCEDGNGEAKYFEKV